MRGRAISLRQCAGSMAVRGSIASELHNVLMSHTPPMPT